MPTRRRQYPADHRPNGTPDATPLSARRYRCREHRLDPDLKGWPTMPYPEVSRAGDVRAERSPRADADERPGAVAADRAPAGAKGYCPASSRWDRAVDWLFCQPAGLDPRGLQIGRGPWLLHTRHLGSQPGHRGCADEGLLTTTGRSRRGEVPHGGQLGGDVEELAVAVLADPNQQGEPRWVSTRASPRASPLSPLRMAIRREASARGTYAPPARSDPAGAGNVSNPAAPG